MIHLNFENVQEKINKREEWTGGVIPTLLNKIYFLDN